MVTIKSDSKESEITVQELQLLIERNEVRAESQVRSREIFGDDIWRRLGDTEPYRRVKNGRPIRRGKSAPVLPVSHSNTPFGVLLDLGKAISGVGGVIVVLAIIYLIVALIGAFVGQPGISGVLAAVMPGLALAAGGLLMVGGGQAITCLVAIERNTRETYSLLK